MKGVGVMSLQKSAKDPPFPAHPQTGQARPCAEAKVWLHSRT